MKISRTLRLAGATGAIRTASFNEKEHLVVPVVALVEGVVWAVNSPTPELVLAEEFSHAFPGWNGRPVVGDHPDIGGQKVSANDPHILESNSFGIIFNTEVKDNKLTMEAWLDPSKAEKVGEDAVRVCERAKNGEPIEVSVGVYMHLENSSGIKDGKRYEGVWRDIVPDHLAMLPEGVQGACSNEMGCGAPRAASVHLVTAQGLVPLYEVVKTPESPMPVSVTDPNPPAKRSLKERLSDALATITSAGKKDMTGNKIMDALSRAAMDTVPGFAWVDDYNPNSNEVYIAAMDSDYNLKYFTGKYKLTDSEEATIDKDSLKEVVKKQVYEPVAAAAATPQPTAACGCHNKENNMTREARIAALISSGKYKEADKTWLANVPDHALAALESGTPENPLPPGHQDGIDGAGDRPTNEQPKTNPTQPATTPAQPTSTPTAPKTPATTEPKTPSRSTAAQTAEDFIAGVQDPRLREVLNDGIRLANERRSTLIKALKDTGRNKFTDEQLEAKSTEELQTLAELAAVPVAEPVSFEGRGGPRVAATGGVEKPPSFVTTLQTPAKAN